MEISYVSFIIFSSEVFVCMLQFCIDQKQVLLALHDDYIINDVFVQDQVTLVPHTFSKRYLHF